MESKSSKVTITGMKKKHRGENGLGIGRKDESRVSEEKKYKKRQLRALILFVYKIDEGEVLPYIHTILTLFLLFNNHHIKSDCSLANEIIMRTSCSLCYADIKWQHCNEKI